MELRLAILNKDPREFFEFPVVRGTMFVDHPRYISHELKVLKSNPSWRQRWEPAIRESGSIPAPPCPYFSKTSGNIIHQAFHVQSFERAVGVEISQLKVILEFGGGYGGMCRLVHRLGFRGRYFIYDLPEFSALQGFYLGANNVPVGSMEDHLLGAICISDFYELEEVKRTILPDLFIATWSLSETSIEFRRKVLDRLDASHWLIAYQHQFGNIDNARFFEEWTRNKPEVDWQTIALCHMPERQGYLIGTQTHSRASYGKA